MHKTLLRHIQSDALFGCRGVRNSLTVGLLVMLQVKGQKRHNAFALFTKCCCASDATHQAPVKWEYLNGKPSSCSRS